MKQPSRQQSELADLGSSSARGPHCFTWNVLQPLSHGNKRIVGEGQFNPATVPRGTDLGACAHAESQSCSAISACRGNNDFRIFEFSSLDEAKDEVSVKINASIRGSLYFSSRYADSLSLSWFRPVDSGAGSSERGSVPANPSITHGAPDPGRGR